MYLIVLAALAALTVLMAGQDVALTVALAVVGALALTPSDGLAGSADPSANPKVACETAALTQYGAAQAKLADEEHAGQLQPEEARLLLISITYSHYGLFGGHFYVAACCKTAP